MAKAKPQEITHDAIVGRFGDRLRRVRVEKGMTQAQLAVKAQASSAYVGRLERGKVAPGIDLVARLARAMACRVADLLPDEDPPDVAGALREQARTLLDSLAETRDEAALSLAVQVLARLVQTAASGD